MEFWLPAIVSLSTAVIASSGFWAYLRSKDTRKDASVQLLLGLAHDRIIYLGMSYIDRGWITKDEYEDLMKYLYDPYQTFGGNGLAEKIMNEVKTLPIHGGKRSSSIQFIKEHHERQRDLWPEFGEGTLPK